MTSFHNESRPFTRSSILQIGDVEDMQEATKELESSVEKDEEEVIEQKGRTINAVIFPSFRNRPLSVLDHFPVMPKNQ